MKRFRLNLLMCVVAANALIYSACNDKKEPDQLSVSINRLDFTATDASGKTVNVETNVKIWVPSSTSDWIIIEKQERSFTVKVTNNTLSAGSRTGMIVVKAGNAEPAEVIVVQETQITLTLNPSSISFAENEITTKSVVITPTSANWSFSCPADWLILSKAGATLNATVNELNFGNAARTATVTVTAGSAAPVSLQVTQAVSKTSVIIFDRADVSYYGDAFELGVGMYFIYLSNASRPDFGVAIATFSTLQPDGEDPKLDVGTYTFDEENGDARTFFYGHYGNLLVDDNSQIIFTGGEFTVAFDKGVYTITTNFTGEDNSKKYDNLQYKFTGNIFFEDLTPIPELVFKDIPTSGNYSAKGIPSWFDSSGPETWTGKFGAFDDEYGQYLAFNTFEDVDLDYFCKFEDGGIFIDGAENLGGNNSYDAFFRAFFVDDEYIYLFDEDDDYPVRYFKTTGVLDFSTYLIDDDGTRITAWVGIVALPKSGARWEGTCFSDLYENLKYQLTVTSSSAKKLGNKTFPKNKGIPLMQTKSLKTTNKTVIHVDKSKLEKIHKSQFKILDVNTFQAVPKNNSKR